MSDSVAHEPVTQNSAHPQDLDRNQFALAGPVQSSVVDDWIAAVVQEQEAGRYIRCHDITEEGLIECRSHANAKKLSKVEAAELITLPRNRSNDFTGKLPSYASKADRAKIVKILCKGKCKKVLLAELNQVYPGQATLKNAKPGEYRAQCLRCGSIATDNYNWYR